MSSSAHRNVAEQGRVLRALLLAGRVDRDVGLLCGQRHLVHDCERRRAAEVAADEAVSEQAETMFEDGAAPEATAEEQSVEATESVVSRTDDATNKITGGDDSEG